MILQEEFRKNGYTDILKGDVASEYGINMEDIFDLDEKPEELLGIFISEQKDDLFFLLDGDSMEINSLCDGCNGVQREHNKKLNNGLPILHKVPPKRDYGRYFCIMAEKGGTSHGGLTEKLSLFFHAKKQEVNAYGR